MNHLHNANLDPSLPNCWQCEHFAISWDMQRPYSCRIMGFKSKALPSTEVFKADGQACQCFYPKKPQTLQHPQASLKPNQPAVKPLTVKPVGARSWLV